MPPAACATLSRDARLKLMEVPPRAGDADHRDGQGASLDHRIERGKDHFVGEIAGRAEQHERIGRL